MTQFHDDLVCYKKNRYIRFKMQAAQYSHCTLLLSTYNSTAENVSNLKTSYTHPKANNCQRDFIDSNFLKKLFLIGSDGIYEPSKDLFFFQVRG